jgi:peptidoglycan/xylan/chitin deacetylase (PgdA/CDA1 family)
MTHPLRWLAHAGGEAFGRRHPFVLCYHGVGAISASDDPHGIFVSRELFARHLEVIEARGYELLTVGDLWRRMAGGSSATGHGSITFDDGLRKTAREAIPMLLARDIPCSMFVPTGLMGRPHPDLDGELIVGPDEVLELAAAGVEIGTHSIDHVPLNGIPYGSLSEETIRAAEEAGYETACACSGPGPWRALSIPREPVFASATPLRLRLKMAGLYGPAYALVGEHGPLNRRREVGVGS